MDNPPSLINRVKNAVASDVAAGAHRQILAGFGATASLGIAALSIYYLYQYGQAPELAGFLTSIGSSVISDQLRSWAEGASKPSLEDVSTLLQQGLEQNQAMHGALAILNERLDLLQQLTLSNDEAIRAELLSPRELETQFQLFGTDLTAFIGDRLDQHSYLQGQLQLQLHALAVAAYPPEQALPYYRGLATRLRRHISSGHQDTKLRHQLEECEAYVSQLEQAVLNGDISFSPPADLQLEEILETLFQDNYLSGESRNSTRVITEEGRISTFIADYRSIFGGRNRELEELDKWLEQPDKPFGLMLACAGLGKSALVANWVSRLRAQSRASVIFHPISLRYGTNRRRDVITSLLLQLRRIRNKPTRALPPAERDLENEFLLEFQADSPTDKPLLVVIDGLDELDVALTQQIALPAELGNDVHLLVTARDDLVTEAGAWCQRFGWSPTYVEVFTPGKLSMSEVQHVVQQQGILGDKQAIHQLTEEVYRLSCEGDPLTTRLWINEVLDLQRSQGVPAFLTIAAVRSMQLDNREPGIDGYLVWAIRQLEQAGVKSAPLFEVLAAALGPMMAQDIEYFVSEARNLTPRQLLNVSRNLIVGDGDKVGYSFSHAEIGNAYRKLYFTEFRSHEWIQRFRDYGRSVYDQLKNQTLPAEAASEHVLGYYTAYLIDNRVSVQQKKLFDLIDESWMKAHYAVLGRYDGFLTDVGRAWSVADEIGQADSQLLRNISTLAVQVRGMVCSASITSLASELPPKLPALLARDGLWEMPRAVGYSTRHPVLLRRVEAQLALLNTPEVNWKMDRHDQDPLCSDILNGIRLLAETETSMVRSQLIIDVLPHLKTPYSLETAFELANGLHVDLFRLKTLASILPKVSDEKTALHLTEQIVQGCINLDLDPSRADEYLDYVPELYELVGQTISIASLDAIWGTIDGDSKTGQDDAWQVTSPKVFLDHLAWHLPGEKGEDFVDFLLAHCSLSLTGVRVLRLAPRLDDQTALDVANKLFSQAQASPGAMRSEVIWSLNNEYKPVAGCGLALIALAWDRQEPTIRSTIVSMARQYIKLFSAMEKPLSGGDLSVFCELIQGTQSDLQIAALVRTGEFLDFFGKYSSGSSLPSYAEEIMRYVGPETIAALIDKARLRSSWAVAQSPYLLANMSQRIPASALGTIFEYGPGRYEYIRIGYLRAVAQCIMRMQSAARIDSLKWVLDLWAPKWLLQLVGPYVQVSDLEDAELREKFIDGFRYIGPFVTPEVGRIALKAEPYWESTRDENLLVLVQYHLRRDERLPILQSFEQKTLRIGDSGQQLGLLKAFSEVGGWRVRRGLARALATSEELTYGKTRKFWRKLGRPKQPIPWNTDARAQYTIRKVAAKDASYWDELRRKVQAINYLATPAARQQALINVHRALGDIVFQITNEAYWEYAKYAPNIWGATDPSVIEEAVSMLLDPLRTLTSIESHNFVRTIIPPVTLFRKDLLPQLEEHIENRYQQLRARQYSLIALFLSDDEQLLYLQKSVAAFPYAEMQHIALPFILTEISQYASSDLVPQLLQWIRLYPCTPPLTALAARITWTDEYLAIAYDTLRQVETPLHEVMRALAPYLNSKWMGSFITLLFERNSFREQYESYPYLLQSWLQMQPTDIYAVWQTVLHDLGRYRRAEALEQLNWFAAVAFKLGGTNGVIGAGNNVVELSSWWPVEWQPPEPLWRRFTPVA